MARLFNDASSEYLYIASTPITAVPLSMSVWFNCDDASNNGVLCSIGRSDAESHWFALRACLGLGYVQASTRAVNFSGAVSSSGPSINTWHHAGGVWAAVDDRRAFLDGGNKGTEGTSRTPAGLDRIGLGLFYDLTPTDYYSGHIAEVAIWNVALTDEEMAVLGAGYSPLFVHPQNLVAYWPLIRGLNDLVGGNALTASGTAVSVHPRIIRSAPMGTFDFESDVINNDKLSMISYNQPFNPAIPVSSVSFDQANKQHLIWQYSGILWATSGAVAPTSVFQGPLTGPMGGPI